MIDQFMTNKLVRRMKMENLDSSLNIQGAQELFLYKSGRRVYHQENWEGEIAGTCPGTTVKSMGPLPGRPLLLPWMGRASQLHAGKQYGGTRE